MWKLFFGGLVASAHRVLSLSACSSLFSTRMFRLDHSELFSTRNKILLDLRIWLVTLFILFRLLSAVCVGALFVSSVFLMLYIMNPADLISFLKGHSIIPLLIFSIHPQPPNVWPMLTASEYTVHQYTECHYLEWFFQALTFCSRALPVITCVSKILSLYCF